MTATADSLPKEPAADKTGLLPRHWLHGHGFLPWYNHGTMLSGFRTHLALRYERRRRGSRLDVFPIPSRFPI